uniref:Interferon regulatory factor 2-binding protein 1/2-like C3HC4 zinc finger domain-containing protein n=1 Tax=Parascaris equorum TaxID=6256 RepID=A0A914RRS5_PAREQ
SRNWKVILRRWHWKCNRVCDPFRCIHDWSQNLEDDRNDLIGIYRQSEILMIFISVFYWGFYFISGISLQEVYCPSGEKCPLVGSQTPWA